MFLLFGSTITESAAQRCTASRICAVDGFIDWPPATMCCTPRLAKSCSRPSPTATATTPVVTCSTGAAPALGLLPDPRLLFALLHLLVQVGDADLGGTTGDDAGLDGGADVVRVHVAVPDPVAADDDDRVAEVTPGLLELRDRVVGRVEEVHDLVAQLGDVVASRRRHGGAPRPRPAWTPLRARARGVRHTTLRQASSSSSKPRPPASTTPGIAEHRQEVGGAGDGGARRVRGPFEHVAEGCLAARGRLLDGLGREPHHGEDRPLDRAEHRLVGGVGGAPQAGDHVGSRDRLERRERVGEAAEDLREDHARVPAGAHQRTVPDRLADLLHVGAVGGQLVDDRFERERHVGAGVAVGHRVDVEAVQLFLVVAQHVAVRGDHAAQISRRE